MSLEKISPSEPWRAIAAYREALPVMEQITTEIQTSLATSSTQSLSETRITPSGSFAKYRELWRWVERLLRRAIVLCARTEDVAEGDGTTALLWPLATLYRSFGIHWPASFRPEHRSTVATLHLRAFVLRAQRVPKNVLQAKAPRWISTARSVLQEFRALLSVCTHFPRAGERNVRVEDFVDLCVAVWEADGAVGEYAGWVIDVSPSFSASRHVTHPIEPCVITNCSSYGGRRASRSTRSASTDTWRVCSPSQATPSSRRGC